MTATAAVARRLSGSEGVWFFITADMSLFAIFFCSFLFERAKKPELFEASRRLLNPHYAGVNTLILLTSSWLVFAAVRAVRDSRAADAPRLIAMAIACGASFGVLKMVEYGEKFGAGISMLSNDFFMFYFVLTGIHLLHVVAGSVVLAVLLKKLRQGEYGAQNCSTLEAGATYWHMVDLIWIILFPLLYLLA